MVSDLICRLEDRATLLECDEEFVEAALMQEAAEAILALKTRAEAAEKLAAMPYDSTGLCAALDEVIHQRKRAEAAEARAEIAEKRVEKCLETMERMIQQTGELGNIMGTRKS